MGRVQVIIPAFNSPAGMLDAAVDSALAEPEVAGVLVVDDGSEPPLPVMAAAQGDGRVLLLRQTNAGPSAARNLGIEQARAPFVLLLDHDDVLEPGGVESGVALAERLGAVAVVSARHEQRGSERRLKQVPPRWQDQLLPSPGEVFRPLAIFGASGLLLRRRCLEQVRFDVSLQIGEDRDFLRRLADVGPIAVSSAPMLTVRLHEGGGNLCSPRHLARRIQDHLVIVERHHDQSTDEPLREQTIWLLNALAKQRPLDTRLWDRLRALAERYDWDVPLKCRVRAWRGALTHGR